MLRRNMALLNCGITTLLHCGITKVWNCCYIVTLLHCDIAILWLCYIATLWLCCYIVALLLHCDIAATLWHNFTFSESFCYSEVNQKSNLHLKASNKFSSQYIFLFGATFVCSVNANTFSFESSTHILRNEKLPLWFCLPLNLCPVNNVAG